MYKVKKRDGSIVEFEMSKINSAIENTFKSCGRDYQDTIIDKIVIRSIADAEKTIQDSTLSVESIQDSVEKTLMNFGYEDVAKAYILYRKQHERNRNAKDTVLDYKKTIENYTNSNDWRVKENSTVTYSLGGLILGNSGAVTANYWLSEVYDEEIANAHRNCEFHIHDLSMLSAYCAGWSLKQLIQEGLGGVSGKITSKPAKHLSTLCNQMVNFLGCFTDDTRIILSNGTKPTIREMLDSGETSWLVKSYDPSTNKVIDSKMDNLHKTRTVSEYIELEFEDGDIVKCTTDHKFYTYNRGWVQAKDLTDTDDVANLENRKDIVYKVIRKTIIKEEKDVYCGTVHNDFHGFFVNDGKLVHNCLQNEWAGAQAFSSVDTYLAPFVKVDDLTYKEVKQCIQSLVFGLNIPSRWGSQAPFTNFTMDWTVPDDLAELNCIVGGEEQNFKYKDCKREMDMINKAFMEVMMDGDANGRGMQYPIPTYSITKDFDWDEDTPNNRLLFEMTAKYGIPYFSNYVNSDMSPSDLRAMCCRLRLDLRELRRKSGGYFGSGESTGSIGVVTLNLPRLAYTSTTKENFYEKLDKLMDIAARSLKIKRDVVSQLLEAGLYPYTKRYLGSFNNHFSTLGLVGMNECCLNAKWVGKDISTEAGKKFAQEVLDHMRNKLSDYQELYGDLFNLEATPAESTTYRFAKHDKEDYPNIITAGDKTNGAPYYTNSSHLPVGYTDDIFEALDHQDDLQTKYTSGTVFHAFLGEKLPDWKSAMRLTRKIAENYKLPYFTFSPTYSICPDHGYIKGEEWKCPTCGKTTEVYSRVTGYYRAVQNFNDGKEHEFMDRKEYVINTDELCTDDNTETKDIAKEKEVTIPKTNLQKPTLFTTSTCPNCQKARATLDSINYDYDIIVADVNPELAISLGITTAPTLYIPSTGKKIENVSNIIKYIGNLTVKIDV